MPRPVTAPAASRTRMAGLGRGIRRAPATAAAAVLLWLLGAATGALLSGPPAAVLDAVGAGVRPLSHGRVDTLLTSAVWCSGLPGYLAATAGLLLLVGPAEARLGTARAAGLFALTHVVGLAAALGVVALGGTAERWAAALAQGVVVGPFAGVVGTGLALSSRFSVLWRRRVRLVLLVGLVLLVLYSGELADVVRLVAALVGLLAGRFLLGGAPRAGVPSRTEARLLVAVLVAATALGPVVAAFSAAPIGPLSVLQYVLLPPPPPAADVQQVCATPAVADDCAALQARLRLSGVGPAMLSLVPVLLLLVLAVGLRRGRRAALRGAVAANLALAVLGAGLGWTVLRRPVERLVVFSGLVGGQFALATALPLLMPLVVVVVLLITRRRFTVRAPAGTYRRVAIVVATALVAVSAVYLVGGTLLADGFDRPPSTSLLLVSLPFRFVPPGYLAEVTPPFLPVSVPATLLFEWTGTVFWLVVAAALLRSFLTARAHAVDADARRARSMIERDGGTLSWLATWPGNTYWFSADGGPASRTGSRAVSRSPPATRSATPAPGPLGGRVRRRSAARTAGPVPLQHHRRGPKPMPRPGAAAPQVAEETVLAARVWRSPARSSRTSGRRSAGRRRPASRRSGSATRTPRWRIRDQIRAISEGWVADKGAARDGLHPRRHRRARRRRRALPHRRGRRPHGARRDQLAAGATGTGAGRLDAGLHASARATGFSGVMEFLIASAALDCKKEGAEFLSLSGAPLARHDRDAPTDALQQLLAVSAKCWSRCTGSRRCWPSRPSSRPCTGRCTCSTTTPWRCRRSSARSRGPTSRNSTPGRAYGWPGGC